MLDVAIWCLIIGIVCILAIMMRVCPREILGDMCRGPYCDHSREAIDEAWREKERQKDE